MFSLTIILKHTVLDSDYADVEGKVLNLLYDSNNAKEISRTTHTYTHTHTHTQYNTTEHLYFFTLPLYV